MLKTFRETPLRSNRFVSSSARIMLAVFVIQAVFLMTDPANAKSDVAQAREVVETLTNEALVMNDETKQPRDQRLAAFRGILRKYFAFDLISQMVAGRYWLQMSDRQQSDYKRLFAEWTARAYAVQLSNYNGGGLRIDKVLPMDDDTVIVRSNVVGSDRKIIVDWRIRKIDGAHKIIDVSVGGISMVATRRSEIGSIIRRENIDGLIDKLQKNI